MAFSVFVPVIVLLCVTPTLAACGLDTVFDPGCGLLGTELCCSCKSFCESKGHSGVSNIGVCPQPLCLLTNLACNCDGNIECISALDVLLWCSDVSPTPSPSGSPSPSPSGSPSPSPSPSPSQSPSPSPSRSPSPSPSPSPSGSPSPSPSSSPSQSPSQSPSGSPSPSPSPSGSPSPSPSPSGSPSPSPSSSPSGSPSPSPSSSPSQSPSPSPSSSPSRSPSPSPSSSPSQSPSPSPSSSPSGSPSPSPSSSPSGSPSPTSKPPPSGSPSPTPSPIPSQSSYPFPTISPLLTPMPITVPVVTIYLNNSEGQGARIRYRADVLPGEVNATVSDNEGHGVVTIEHTVDGESVQPDGEVEICVWVSNYTESGRYHLIRGDPPQPGVDSVCEDDLDIIDSNVYVADRRGDQTLLCGVTTHFTNFAMLLEGEDGVKIKPCSTSFDWQWLLFVHLLSLSCVIFLVFIIIIAVLYNRRARKLFFGREGNRVLMVRDARDKFIRRTTS